MRAKAWAKYIPLWVAAFFSTTQAPGALVLEGKIYDGPASMLEIQTKGLTGAKVPLAQAQVEFRSLKAGNQKTWRATTGADGSFSVSTGLGDSETEIPFVAIARREGTDLFTASFNAAPGKPLQLVAYPASDDASRCRVSTKVYHTIHKSAGIPHLTVRMVIELTNLRDTLYVGKPVSVGEAGATSYNGDREVFRLPLPAGAVIEKNEGPVAGTKMKVSPDGKFLILDEPISGLFQLLDSMGADGKTHSPAPLWSIEYDVPASNVFAMSYPQPIKRFGPEDMTKRLPGFLVYIQAGDMDIDDTVGKLKKLGKMEDKPPLSSRFGDSPVEFNIYGIKPEYDKSQAPVPVVIQVSDVAIEEVSEKALFWHGGTISIILLTVLCGLYFGRKAGGPSVGEGTVGGKNYDVLDQIAVLDSQLAAGSIAEEEYQARREILVEIAASEFESETSRDASEVPSQQVSSATRELLARITELDGLADGGVEEAQERAHLLESLFKSLRNDQGT